jgi:hypothetical protein
VEIDEANRKYRAIANERELEAAKASRRRLPYGNLFPSSSPALLAEGRFVPVISFSGRKGGAGKRAASTSSSLVERTSLRRGRIIRLNLKLGTDILVPSGPLGRKPRFPSRAMPGRVLDEVAG